MSSARVLINQKCFHCGEPCEKNKIVSYEKIFCCSGCQTVHDILIANNMESYYALENYPGTQQSYLSNASKFDYLNLPEIREKLIVFRQAEMEKVILKLPQIHCASCVWLLENLHQWHEDIHYCRINYLRKEAEISYNSKQILLSEIALLLQKIGYTPELNLKDTEKKKEKNLNPLLYKTGLAGFAFGNVMLFSFPEYLGLNFLQENKFQSFFSYWNLMLALPVFFYSAQDYFISAYKSIVRKKLHLDVPIAIGIMALFGKSVFDILSQNGTGYTDSLTGLIFFMLCGKWFQEYSLNRLAFDRDYKSYFPLAVQKIENSVLESVWVSQIKIGDCLLIHHQEIIPADSLLLEEKVEIDYSFVSGESLPIICSKGDKVYAGGKLISASAKFEVVKCSSQSYLTQLWNHSSTNKESEISQFNALSNQLSRWFTPALLAIAFFSGIYWVHAESWFKGLQVVAAILIVACPCALALSAPFTLGSALSILGRYGFYLKNLNIIEKITHVTTIVFDKTGTLTRNDDCKINFESTSSFQNLHKLHLTLLCNQSLHPLSQLIAQNFSSYENKFLEAEFLLTHFKENTGEGISGIIDGKAYKLGNADFVAIKNKSTTVSTYASCDGVLIGKFNIEFVYRNGLMELIQKLKEKYKLNLISGDSNKESLHLKNIFGEDTTLLFEQNPYDKINFIKSLQKINEKVMMIGDGLNDAGALMQSHVGIAVSDNISNFSPACDAVLHGTQLNKLNVWINYCRVTVKLVKVAFIISLIYNTIGICIAATGNLQPLYAAILMPISSLSVVIFGVLSTSVAEKILFKKIKKPRFETIP